ncbi:MAG: TolC family protein [Acidobacteriota bacterium]
MNRGLAVIAVVLAIGAPARAQTPAPTPAPAMRTVEFGQAIREAIERNPTVGQAAVSIARAEALVAQARSLTFPSASANVTTTTLDGARGFDGGVTQPRNQIAIGGDVRYVVGGFAVLGQARDQVDVATATSVQAKQGVAIAAAEAYLAVIAGRRQVEVANRAVETAQAHLDYADRRLQGGAGSRLNQLRAAQAVTGDRLQLEQAQLALRRAQEALGVALASENPVDAGAEPAFDVPATIDENAWMQARPDLVTQEAIRRAAERVVRDSWIDWTPFPTVAFDPQIVTPSGLFQPSRTWRLTVSAVQPLFDGGQRRAQKRIRQTSVDQSRFALTGLQIQARSEVRIAQEAVQSLGRALTTARTAVEQATDVLRITTAAFEVGATTNIEVIDAQRLLRDSETSAAFSEDAVRHAKLDLMVAIGKFPQ